MKYPKIIATAFMVGVLTITSCTPTKNFTQVAYTLDYQKAGKGKVFITEANSVSFEYEPIASLVVLEEGGKSVSSINVGETIGDEVYGVQSTVKVKTKGWRNPSIASALDFAVEQCIKQGGDGLINLKYHNIVGEMGGIKAVELTGMVIKRK